MKLAFLVILFCVYQSEPVWCEFTPEKAIKLADYMRVMMRYPKYEYLPHIRKCLHMYAGILSYLTLKLEEESDDSSVEDFYLFGPPRFMTMPIKDRRVQELKKTYKWDDRDLKIFLEELNDAKKVWREFSRTMLSKKSHISAEPVPHNSLVID